MQLVSFVTSNPYDHVPRAFDILRKMGFGLGSASVEPCGAEHRVAIAFEPKGPLSAGVFLDRLSQMKGLTLRGPQLAALAPRTPGRVPASAAGRLAAAPIAAGQ